LRKRYGSACAAGSTRHRPPSRLLARDGVPLPEVLRSYRVGQEAVFARAAALVDEADERSPGDAVARIAMLSFHFTDAAMADVAAEYERERETLIRDTVAKRDRTVRALLAGATMDRLAAERTLGYRLDAAHLACTAWGPPATPTHVLERATRAALLALGGERPLLLGEPTGVLAAWIHVDAEPTATRLDRARAALGDTGVRVALGTPAEGPQGFARSKQQADLARAAARLRDEPALVTYHEVALAAVLLRDPDAARRFAAEELGPLAAADRASRELRATLSAYLAAGLDQTAAAHVLHLHRNSVARRLQRAEELLGHPLSHRAPELAAALTIADWVVPFVEGD
jgi:DNA-binding PucR family transcriptional regulator